jgi:hypothetical protein
MTATRKPGEYTMQEACEHIVKANIFKRPLSAEQIFNYSPSGELFMIWEWFKIACEKIGEPVINQ